MKNLIFFFILEKVFGGFNEIVGNFFRLDIFDYEKFFIWETYLRRYAEDVLLDEGEKNSLEYSKKRKLFHDIVDTLFPDHEKYATKFEFIGHK